MKTGGGIVSAYPAAGFYFDYRCFTDIEFNPAKSINTQARAAAMIRLLLDEYGELPDFSKEDFIQYHKEHIVYDALI